MLLNNLPDIPTLITYAIILLTAFPVHEFAHAWMANRFGDDTPRLYGRLTLNPLAHLDIIGSLLMLLVGFGWAKPVPINPYTLSRNSRAAPMWVALAGPLSNFLMAILAAIPFRLGLFSPAAMVYANTSLLPSIPQVLGIFVYVNLLLALFNLIPLYPLDGEKVVDYLLPPQVSRALESIRPYSSMILLGLAVLGVIGVIIVPPLRFLFRLLIGL